MKAITFDEAVAMLGEEQESALEAMFEDKGFDYVDEIPLKDFLVAWTEWVEAAVAFYVANKAE
mgnify:CR=1 FL=1